MNLSDRLHQIAASIKAGAPHLSTLACELETIVGSLAPAIAAAAPGSHASKVADEVVNAVTTAHALETAIVGAAATVLTPASQTPVVQPIATPTVDTSATETNAVDQGAVAAANVSAGAGSAAGNEALSGRVMVLESSMVELLPMIGQLSQSVATLLAKFGHS